MKKLSISLYYGALPNADGSEEPVSEFLFDKFLHCDLQNHTSPTTIAMKASTPAAPPTTVAIDFDIGKNLCVSFNKVEHWTCNVEEQESYQSKYYTS